MNRPILFLLALILTGSAFAQQTAEPMQPLPPPDIDDPAAIEAAIADAKPRDNSIPEVIIHEDENGTVEEYRRNGQVYMVKVTPNKGIPYTYLDTDGDGRLEGDPKRGAISPVYYTLYEWE